jgi:hypothetical protein
VACKAAALNGGDRNSASRITIARLARTMNVKAITNRIVVITSLFSQKLCSQRSGRTAPP